jgi:TRAP-type C4-dicarboxylate transport system permease small subunit
MKTIGKVISAINGGAAGLAGILVLLMVAHVAADVTMRFVFEKPLDATILYVSVYYMVAIAFLPLGIVEQKNSHISVELLAERFPAKIQTVLLFFATLITVIVTSAVAVRTGQEALTKYATGAFSIEAGGKVLTWPTYFYLPLGFGMMAVVSFWKLVAMITGKDSGLSLMTVEDPYLAEEKTNV